MTIDPNNPTYTRGTPTFRIKTARLVNGDRVLTKNGPGTRPNGLPVVHDAQTKTGAIVRTVHRIEKHDSRDRFARQVKYRVHFMDGTYAEELAPILTWHAVENA